MILQNKGIFESILIFDDRYRMAYLMGAPLRVPMFHLFATYYYVKWEDDTLSLKMILQDNETFQSSLIFDDKAPNGVYDRSVGY
jgi:hypothetical protein